MAAYTAPSYEPIRRNDLFLSDKSLNPENEMTRPWGSSNNACISDRCQLPIRYCLKSCIRMASSSSSTEAISNALVQQLNILSLTASTPEFPEYLPFHPSGKYESLRENFSAIPRYLFR